MKERPILFSAPMIRALRAGEKTQTRRMVKGAASWAELANVSVWNGETVAYFEGPLDPPQLDCHRQVSAPIRCPYGAVGDRLWCRETWACLGGDEDLYQHEPRAVSYRATWDQDQYAQFPDRAPFTDYVPGGRWRPSIFMPRWASRLTLPVAEVRVERVQAISEADALAEGMEHYWNSLTYEEAVGVGNAWTEAAIRYGWEKTPPDFRGLYAVLWDKINGKGSFAADPFVWVVSTERVTP